MAHKHRVPQSAVKLESKVRSVVFQFSKMAYLRHMVFAVAAAILLVHVFGAATMVKRSETANQEAEPCSERTPCGWAIYNRTTRYIEYFMKNRCFCDNERKCLRDDDDISIAAYVYRCKIEESQKGSKS